MAIGSIGSFSASAALTRPRPDPAEMASKLFSRLDTKGQGYLQQSDLASALSRISSSSGSSSAGSASSDSSALFQALDSDSDGKVTETEFSSTIQKLAEALDSQAFSSRLGGAHGQGGGPHGAGGMPPPPPPQEDAGFTQDQLSSQLAEVGASSDSQRASRLSDIVSNFAAADGDGDGKVSLQEAMAYQQSSQSSTSGAAAASSADAGSASGPRSDAALMHQVMELVRAYAAGQENSRGSGSLVASA